MTRREQLDSFYQYANSQIERDGGESSHSLLELLDEWQQSLNPEELISLLDARSEAARRGETYDFDEFMGRMYEKHGINKQ